MAGKWRFARGSHCWMGKDLKGDFLGFFHVRYSTLRHLPPLRFRCVVGCWDRTQDCCDCCIESQTLYHLDRSPPHTRLDLIHYSARIIHNSVRSHSYTQLDLIHHSARSYPHTRLDLIPHSAVPISSTTRLDFIHKLSYISSTMTKCDRFGWVWLRMQGPWLRSILYLHLSHLFRCEFFISALSFVQYLHKKWAHLFIALSYGRCLVYVTVSHCDM
jgi:hypothetical protein